MSLLSGLTTDNNIAQETDNLGGGGVLDTNIYKVKVTMAYLQKSRTGALGLHLHFETEDKRDIRQTLYVTSGDAKGNKNYYENARGEKHYLPGFTHADALCLLTVGRSLAEMDTEDKVVSIYNPEVNSEVPTQVPVLVDLLGQEVILGIQKQIEDKRAKNDATGQYEPTGETREVNEIDKVFRARDGMTTAEIRAEQEEASFIHSWKEKWEGKTRDRSTKQNGNGTAGAPRAAGAAQAPAKQPRQSLFA